MPPRPPRSPHELASIFGPDQLARRLPEPGTWRPLPTVANRRFWTGIDASTRDGLLAEAERQRGEPWPELPATLWLDYTRTGNRVHYEDRYFGRRDRLAAAVVAACLTDDPRWHDEVLDGVWLLLEETSWCIPPHEGYASQGGVLPDPDRPSLDLFAAETGALLAWTYAVLKDRLHELAPAVPPRLVREVRKRVLVPQRTVDDWVWFGRSKPHVNNWNPWINSNVLVCSLLLDDSAADILTSVERAVEGLDVFLRDYPDDGGCDEGAVYWWRAGASLAECLETLRDVTGLDAFGLPVIGEMIRYLHRVHLDGDWYVNVADGAAKLDRLNASAYLPWLLGRRIGDEAVSAHGRAIRGDGPVVETGAQLGRSLGRTLLALADDTWRAAPAVEAPRLRQTYLPDTQLLTARQHAGTADGLFVSLKGGHNAEDHNHNDVGTILVALDGHPVLVDAGVAQYTAKHFGPDRYEIWTLRSDFHNVPAIDGYEQPPGREFAARELSTELSDTAAVMSLDLAAAYPAEAGVRSWRRRIELDRTAERLTLQDRWELDHDPESVVLHLLASAEPTIGPGAITVNTRTRPLRIGLSDGLNATFERIELEDRRLQSVWGEALWRITLTPQPTATGSWTLTLHVG
ncbi:MAG TPA: heparinase II/III family protein [Mycobacteriales bacterium]|nr:heparinase II/III family protein [Mycobacteriales bacterium]